MRRIKIGQIGVNHEHAGGTLATLRALPEVFDVVGVVKESAPAPFGTSDHRDDISAGLPEMTVEELFAVPGLEAVTVEAANRDLVATALPAMERGLHIHMDKPGGESPEPFRRLVEGCRARGLALQLGYMYRNNPGFLMARDLMRKGWLGEVFAVDVSMNRFDNDNYREYLKTFAGGSMYNFGCHILDLVVALLGRPERVTPFLGRTRDDGLVDNGLAVLEYPRASATVRSAVVDSDAMATRHLTVQGTRGSFHVQPLEPAWRGYPLAGDCPPTPARLNFRDDNEQYAAGVHHIDLPPPTGRYHGQLLEFAAVVRGEIANPFPYDHELLTQEVLLAATKG